MFHRRPYIFANVAATHAAPVPTGTPWALPIVFTQAGYFPVQATGGPRAGAGNFGHNYVEANWRDTGTNYYVSTAGNDANNGLSSGGAKRTIQAAHDSASPGSVINVAAGVYANFTNSKNLTVIGAGRSSTFIGDLLTEIDITWGALASGRQTATLVSGAVAGFVDLTKTRRIDYQGVAIPQVSVDAASAATIATLQANTTDLQDFELYATAVGTADPVAGIFRSTPSTLGASDGRDLNGSASTSILAWKDTAAAPIGFTGTSRLFMKNLSLVGGNRIQPTSTTTLVLHDCWRLGCYSDLFFVDGTLITYQGGARGCRISGADIYDYESGGTGVEINCYSDQCSGTGGDNNSTGHGARILRINGLHRDGSRVVNDVGGSIVGVFGTTLGSSRVATARTCAGGAGDIHFAGVRVLDKGSGADLMFAKDSTYPTTRIYVYDNCFSGLGQVDSTAGAANNVYPTDRSGTKDTSYAARTLVKFDPTDSTKMFQDTAGGTPVTAFTQGVRRINSTKDPTDFITFGAGQLTWEDAGGGRGVLRTVTTNALAPILNVTSTPFDENANVIFNVKSSESSLIMMQAASLNYVADVHSSGSFKSSTTALPGFSSPDYTLHVNGSDAAQATAAAFKAAAFNNVRNNITIRSLNISWIKWMRPTGFLSGFDGDIYGIEFFTFLDAADRQAREAALAA